MVEFALLMRGTFGPLSPHGHGPFDWAAAAATERLGGQ